MDKILVKLEKGITASIHRCRRLAITKDPNPIHPVHSVDFDEKYIDLIVDNSINISFAFRHGSGERVRFRPQKTIGSFDESADNGVLLFLSNIKKTRIVLNYSETILKHPTLTFSPGVIITSSEPGYVIEFEENLDSNACSFELPLEPFSPHFIALWKYNKVKLDVYPKAGNDIAQVGTIEAHMYNSTAVAKWDGISCYMDSTLPSHCSDCKNPFCRFTLSY